MKLLLPILCTAFLKTAIADDLISTIYSPKYIEVTIPESWFPTGIPERIKTHESFGGQKLKSTSTTWLIGVYGKPDKMLCPKEHSIDCIMLYELNDAYKIVVYIPSLEKNYFSAAALFKPDGEAEGRILK